MEFDCPECGTHIVGEVSKCPKCGVEFVIEEVAEFECPNCRATVPADSVKCPNCGTRFEVSGVAEASEATEASEAGALDQATGQVAETEAAPSIEELREVELRKQFPLLVEEVKPLLALANDYGIDAAEARRYIDKAVKSGRQRDVVSAVDYVKECLDSVRAAIDDRIVRDIEYLEKLSEISKKTGSDPKAILGAIESIKVKKEEGDLRGALSEAKSARGVADQLTGKYVEANELCEALEKLVQNSERFYVDVRDVRRLLNEAKDAGKHGDWSMMGILARKGREELLASLPDMLKGELKKAKASLLDAKAEGKDVTSMVKILKEAGVSFKRGDHEDSLERLIEFKTEMKRI